MLTTGLFETRSAKLIVAVTALLLLAAFQVAVQAKPAHAWEVSLSIKGAGKITEVTDRGLIASDCTPGGSSGLQSPNTTPTGQVGNSCSPGSPNGLYNSFDVIEYKAEALPGFSFVGWKNADDSSTYNPVLCNGANGSPNYLPTSTNTATNCRFQIFENLKAQAVFQDTTVPSAPSITGPSLFTNQQTATFQFFSFSDPTFKQYECRVTPTVQTTYQPCSSGVSFSPATDGMYTLEVRARDYSNNVSSTNNYTWTLDRVKPDTTLSSGVGPAQNSTTQSTDATFSFSSSEPTGASFECSLDNAAFSACTSPKPYTGLSNATHTFQVRAVDRAGNKDDTPSSRTWTVDNIAPAAPVIDSPANNGLLGTSNFAVSGTAEANSHVEVFDQGASKGTTTANSSGDWSVALNGVSDGSHTYTAKATDAANNTSGVSNASTVTVDAKDPTVTKWTPTGKRVSAGANVVAFFSEAMNGPTVEAPGTFTLMKKGTTKALGATVIYSVTTTSTGNTYKATLNPNRNLRAGVTYVAKLTPAATDLSGNPLVAKTWTFTVKS